MKPTGTWVTYNKFPLTVSADGKFFMSCQVVHMGQVLTHVKMFWKEYLEHNNRWWVFTVLK